MDEAEHFVVPMRFDWPVDGWVRGYQVSLFDANGASVDPSFLHHFVVINFDRRQFVYAAAERLVGVGRETGSVDLPVSFGVPLAPGHRIGVSAAWHNETNEEVEVYLQLIMRWTPADGRRTPTQVMPINLDVNHVPGESSAYELPPGRSARTFEFEAPINGRLLAISGHLHDHGLGVWLEEAESGRKVAEVKGVLDQEGRILRVEQKKWLGLFGQGIRLHAGRRYRLAGGYDNPGEVSLPGGAMAQMIAVFAPDDWTAWPTLDGGNPDYLTDVGGWDLHLTSEEFMRDTHGQAQSGETGPDAPTRAGRPRRGLPSLTARGSVSQPR
jgi:hypothetical protein